MVCPVAGVDMVDSEMKNLLGTVPTAAVSMEMAADSEVSSPFSRIVRQGGTDLRSTMSMMKVLLPLLLSELQLRHHRRRQTET